LALDVSGLSKQFGGVQALDGVNLAVPAGSCYAIVGPNGSGKTTLLNLIAGTIRSDAGTIRIGGPANWEEFTNWQWVTIKDKPNPYPF